MFRATLDAVPIKEVRCMGLDLLGSSSCKGLLRGIRIHLRIWVLIFILSIFQVQLEAEWAEEA